MRPPRSSAHLRRVLLAAAAAPLLLGPPPAARSLSVAPSLAPSSSPGRRVDRSGAPPGPGPGPDVGDDGPLLPLPALARVRLAFSVASAAAAPAPPRPERDGERRRPDDGGVVAPRRRLVLRRRDGLDLYGRPVVHGAGDAASATMTFLDGEADDDGGGEEGDDDDGLWEATLVLRPDGGTGRGAWFRDDRRAEGGEDAPPPPSPSGCFVAMNRFAVRDDCRGPFEERWAARRTRLPSQPGFLGFSLLRRAAAAGGPSAAAEAEAAEEEGDRPAERFRYYDAFNYSTCTIWDSIGSWRAWREGVGRASHAASHGEEGRKRVPVSEWLRAPSSPIFWEGCCECGNGSQ